MDLLLQRFHLCPDFFKRKGLHIGILISNFIFLVPEPVRNRFRFFPPAILPGVETGAIIPEINLLR
jgi:hypothetical protein